MRRFALTLIVLLLLMFSGGVAFGQAAVRPPEGAQAEDRPNDFGGVIKLSWTPSPDEEADDFAGYRVLRASSPDGPWQEVGRVDKGRLIFEDKAAGEEEYYYQVIAMAPGGESPPAVTDEGVRAEANWFNKTRYRSLVLVFLFTAIVLGWIWTAGRKITAPMVVGFFLYTLVFCLVMLKAGVSVGAAFAPVLLPTIAIAIPIVRRNAKIYVRPIPAIQAVEEAIGRATEMGKPILFVPGISTIEDVATLAALNILSPIAEKAAEYDSRLIVPNYDPIVFTVTQEVVKEACLKAGRPDAYSDENVFYLSARQFAYAAAVNGIMVREKPATNFFLGMFFAESLLLAETGNMTGAIQIAGTDSVTQLPFFIVACDYTLIGEELYAAGAYMGDDPKLTGSLKGQDWNKALGIGFLILLPVAFLLVGIFTDPGDWPEWLREIPYTLFYAGKQ